MAMSPLTMNPYTDKQVSFYWAHWLLYDKMICVKLS